MLVLVDEMQRAVPDQSAYLSWAGRQPRVRVLTYPDRPFNFSWVNNWGVDQATGDILCLLNDDTEIITPSWLEKACRPGVTRRRRRGRTYDVFL